MKIREGKRYKTRDGRIVGPVKRTSDIVWPFWIPSENFMPYLESGITTSPSGWVKSRHDLVEESA